MRMSSIAIAAPYSKALPAPFGTHLAAARIGGVYDFSDSTGHSVTAADFEGHWTLLYFGYSRCKGSCLSATFSMVQAATALRAKGIDARAVFVDIDPPPLTMKRRATGAPLGAVHDRAEMRRTSAMRGLEKSHAGRLAVLTGTRSQIARVTAAFRVERQQVPPRIGEEGHSINHSARIYLIAPDAEVAGYGTHNTDPADLAQIVAMLSRVANEEVEEWNAADS